MWTYRERPELKVSPGFLLLLALMFYLDGGSGVFLWALVAAVCHEGGHLLACRAMGGRARGLSLTAAGAELRCEYRAPLSYGRESLVMLAGPAANLLLGAPLLWLGVYLPAAVSLGLGLFNLLPILPLDGGRVLADLVSQRRGPAAADTVLAVTAGVLIGLLGGLGVVAAVRYGNALLLLAGAWLLAGAARQGREK